MIVEGYEKGDMMSDENTITECHSHTIAAVVDEELYEAVTNLKWDMRMSMSEIVRQSLADFVDKNHSQ